MLCEFARHHHVSFPLSNKKSSYALIHSDIRGSSRVPNVLGVHWFVLFIDDCTHITWIFLLKQKSNVNIVFSNYHNMVKNQGVKSDNAKDYFNQTLSPNFQKKGNYSQIFVCGFTLAKWSS